MKGQHYRFTEGALVEEYDNGLIHAYSFWPKSGDLFDFGFSVWTWRKAEPGKVFKHEPEWRLLDREGRLAIWIDYLAATRYQVFGKFLKFIPLNMKMFAGLFDAGDQWRVLERLSTTPQFAETVACTPNYAWLAIWLSGALSKKPEIRQRIAIDIATRPRAEVLGRLAGIKISKSQLKVVNRLERDCLCPESAKHLLSVLGCPNKSRALQHSKKITPDFLEDLAEIPATLFTRNAAKFLSDEKGVKALLHVHRLLQARADRQTDGEFLHTLGRVRTRREFDSLMKKAPFLLPPLQAGGMLRPIRSRREIMRLGRELGQCLGNDHAEMVKNGFAYYFSWTGAEPANVEFIRRDDWEEGEEKEEWSFHQARGRDNALPSNETLFEILKAVVVGGGSIHKIENNKPSVKPAKGKKDNSR